MIRLIATDMDGTLLARDHVTISPRNRSALRAVSDRGVRIVLASGRPWCFVRGSVEALGCVDYAILCNGAGTRAVAEDVWLDRNGLEEPVWRRLFGMLRQTGTPFLTYSDGEAYLERAVLDEMGRHFSLSPEFQRTAERVVTLVDTLEEALAGRRAEKIDSFFVPGAVRASLREELASIPGLYVASGLSDNLEISSAAADKGRSLARLCARLGIAREEVMAFGDGGNDVEMLRWAGCSFAMENGMDCARGAAGQIAPSHQEDGVGRMVERYVLRPEA